MFPSDLRYTEEHEWVKVEGDVAIVGITDYATEELGEIVFCDLPPVGKALEQMDEFGSVESVKTVSSLFSPITGIVDEVNEELVASPNVINDSPYDSGWLIKVKMSDIKEIDDLMTSEEYEQHLDSIG
jgi:glycine cleavage system H protein